MVLCTVGIVAGCYGVALALCWLFEVPGFERRDPRRSWDEWTDQDVDQETRPWGDGDA